MGEGLRTLGDVLTILAALPAIIAVIATAIPKVRLWLKQAPWRAAAATGLITATIISFALWLVLPYAVAGPPGPPGPPGPRGEAGPRSPGSTAIKVVAERIGKTGIEAPGFDPGMFAGDADNHFETVLYASGQQICTLSNIVVGQVPGYCALHREEVNGNISWNISATGGMQCRVTCFKLTPE